MKYIKNYEDRYSITKQGEVYSHIRNIYLKQTLTSGGYLRADLYKDGKVKHHCVHRLVGIAFIKNPENKKTINNINGDKQDNNVNNLEWNTMSENVQHSYDTGLKISQKGEERWNNKLTENQVLEIKSLLKTSLKQYEIAKFYNVRPQTISLIKNNKRWSHLK